MIMPAGCTRGVVRACCSLVPTLHVPCRPTTSLSEPCSVLETKTYSWGGIRDQPTIRGKLKRLALQFTPYNWTVYNLKMVSDFKRFAFVTCLVSGVMLGASRRRCMHVIALHIHEPR